MAGRMVFRPTTTLISAVTTTASTAAPAVVSEVALLPKTFVPHFEANFHAIITVSANFSSTAIRPRTLVSDSTRQPAQPTVSAALTTADAMRALTHAAASTSTHRAMSHHISASGKRTVGATTVATTVVPVMVSAVAPFRPATRRR